MDRNENTQVKKLSSGEYGQARRSTGEAISSRTKESSQANKSTRSDNRQKFDVFLSHSGKQKNFVRQLHRDLTNQGVSCFFDEDRESCLPVGEDFPPHIFKAAETCRLPVLLLSKEFFETKWPMLELSAFVKARHKNPNLKILPLFFLIPPDTLKLITADNEKWKEFEKCKKRRVEWHEAVNAIRGINGLKLSDGGDEVEFRDKIVKEICHILQIPSPRYPVLCMQGEVRMCQEVADFFNKIQHNEKGVRVAGLYGIAGHGKTMLGRAFCNLKLGDFEGKACHLEFSRGDSLERIELALQYLSHCPQSYLRTLTKDQAQAEFYKRVKYQKVFLVLDNITEENIDEVGDYARADLGRNSCVLLCARSVDFLVKHFNIDSESCMRVPRLEEEEAIAILLERAFAGEPKLEAEDRRFALKCANRCSFKEISCDIVRRGRTFHPLALKAFGSHLFNKYGSNLSKWVAETDGLVDRSGYGLDDVFAVLGKAFDDMHPKHRTIFMLLTVYMLPNLSPYKVSEWLAINCNEEISFIEKGVEDLCKKAFIEELEPEIRIHDLYIEFAQSKAEEMGRWLWWNGDGRSTRGFISDNKAGFELAKLDQCAYRSPSQIAPKYLQNLLVLQLVGVQNIGKLDMSRMESLRSITLDNCQDLEALDGMQNLLDLAWLQIRGVNPMFKLPQLSSVIGLQYLEIDIPVSHGLNRLGDLTRCYNLREINVRCPSLLEFPKLHGLPHLEKVKFSLCDKVKGPLDCTECVELISIVFDSCCQMTASPLLSGCKKLCKIVMWECDAVTACPDMDVPNTLKTLDLFISSKAASAPKSLDSCYGLENLQLWNMGELKKLPSFRYLSNLTVLKLGKCGIREPPDLTSCVMLEEVYFFTLTNLERFPNFSLLRKLRKLSLYNCRKVQDPPIFSGCHELQVLHLVYNDQMEGLPNMDEFPRLEEIKLSWHSENEITYEGIDPDSCEVDDDLQSCLEHFKDAIFPNLSDLSMPTALKEWSWLKSKTMLVKQYFRGVKLYYCITAPYESYDRQPFSGQATPEYITLQIIDGIVVPFPTHEMVDGRWIETVRKYFAGKKDIVRPSAASAIPPWPSYRVPAMQGEARMCQEVAAFFNTVQPNEKGIRIAGLYGMAGQGKTTLAKAFCNFNVRNFYGKVCHLDFCGGNALQRQKLALQYLTHLCKSQLESLTREDEAQRELYKRVRGQRVLMVLDTIETEESIDEVRDYLRADLGRNSCILLTARSVDVLQKITPYRVPRVNSLPIFMAFEVPSVIKNESCMAVPSLTEEEAIAILLERATLGKLPLGAEDRGFALKCANRCLLKDIVRGASAFHPLALKTFGRHLVSKYRLDFSKWVAEINALVDRSGHGLDGVFTVLGKAFDDMRPKYRTIIMLLTVYMLPNMSPDKVTEWLAINCNDEIKYIKKALKCLYKNGFIEEIEPQIRIHDFIKQFGRCKANNDDKAGGVKFRSEILRAMSHLLPQRYHVPAMQGKARMCQEVADFFNTVHPNEKGVRIAGLYGLAGQGKTTFAKAFCNLNMANFDGKVCHLELSRGDSFERIKHALHGLGHWVTSEDGSHNSLNTIVEDQMVLLVLDDVTEDSINEVKYYLRADFGKNSCILLSARSIDVILKNFDIDSQSCMPVPVLQEEEAIAILLETTFVAESALGAENRGFSLQCAKRCSFKHSNCGIVSGAHVFHPLVLRTFGRHLFNKYGADLSKWVGEIEGSVSGSGEGLNDVFTVLDKAFDDMDPKYCTIFMLLTVYMLTNISAHKVTEWLEINCEEGIEYIHKAVEDLRQKAFIEEIEPEIRIHKLYMEFAQSKARKMGKWLWCKRDLITSEVEASLYSKDEAGFELAKLEYCQDRDLYQIGAECVKNLRVLQVVDAHKEMRNLEISSMKNIRSVTLQNCKHLEVLEGMENLPYLAWLQIRQVPMLKLLQLGSLTALRHLEINSYGLTEIGDLTGCVSLREIFVRCPYLSEFPRLNSLPYLESVEFKQCLRVIGPLDCRACLELRSIVFGECLKMAHMPLIDDCSNLNKIVLTESSSSSSALNILELCISSADASAPKHSECCDGLKNLPLWNIVILMDIVNLRRFPNLTMLKLYKCYISEPPDVTCCSMLEDVYFCTLKYLKSFPNFSSMRKLKKLCLSKCTLVQVPPDIRGCHELQQFHLLYNDNMKGLPQIDGCPVIEEIKLSWQSEEVPYYYDSYEDGDLEFCLDDQKDKAFPNMNDVLMPVELKEWPWLQGKTVRVKQYFRGEKAYYSIIAPYKSNDGSGTSEQASNSGALDQVIIHRSAISDEDEVRCRDKVIRAIRRLIPPKIRFPYSFMQDGGLSWPEKLVRFKIASPTVEGIHMAGLYEEADEKTKLCESSYKFTLMGFEGEVSSLEFSTGNSVERLNNALKYLTRAPSLEMRSGTSEFLEQDAFSRGPMFNIMILMIRYPIPDKFMDSNFMDIARDFHVTWGGNTRIIFLSERYAVIEFSRN